MTEKMRSSVMGLILSLFSSPLPEVQKQPVAYLYNGVRLPKLPEWDRETYPYATISVISHMTALTVTLTFRKSWKQDVQGEDIPTDAIWVQPGDVE